MKSSFRVLDDEEGSTEIELQIPTTKNEQVPDFNDLEFSDSNKKKLYLYVIGAVVAVIVTAILILVIAIAAHNSKDSSPPYQPPNNQTQQKTVILVSIDGFRYDYFDRYSNVIPTLSALRKSGVFAPLQPQFPSKTFPNHYTIVTGLYPESHGIISNRMYDPVFNATFRVGERESMRNGRWWGGEPVWITGVKQNLTTAVCFWPGSEAPIEGTYATYSEPYVQTMPYQERVQIVLNWLDLPSEKRPQFLAVYFENVDSVGHAKGPNDSEIPIAMATVDSAIQLLLDGLNQRNIRNETDIIVLSDHGMTSLSSDRVILVDDYLDLNEITIVDYTPLLAIIPKDMSKLQEIFEKMEKIPNMKAYKKEEMPSDWHYTNNRRITPLLGVADEGWAIATHSSYDNNKAAYNGGDHGYDNHLKSMRAIFLAQGPSFKEDYVSDMFDNLHVYPLLCDLLGLNPAQNNGTLNSVKQLLK